MKKCRLIKFFIDLALRLLFIDLHFFIATIQIGVIVCNLYLYLAHCGMHARTCTVIWKAPSLWPAGIVATCKVRPQLSEPLQAKFNSKRDLK